MTPVSCLQRGNDGKKARHKRRGWTERHTKRVTEKSIAEAGQSHRGVTEGMLK
jgi:hypothetical protein